jgi:hypothetical protein
MISHGQLASPKPPRGRPTGRRTVVLASLWLEYLCSERNVQ